MSPRKKIGKAFALRLLRLMGGEELSAGELGAKNLLEELLEERVLEQYRTGRGRRKIYCADPERVRNHLRIKFGIIDLKKYVMVQEEGGGDGERSLQATRSTKALRNRSLQGFFIKSLGVEITMSGASLPPLPPGVEYFASDFTRLVLADSATVVGVENPECFVKIERLRRLFPASSLFVMRYHSRSPVEWLETIPNPYLHFGDFDPAGVAIYVNEFLKRLGENRCRFFVPQNAEDLVSSGQNKLYDRQRHLLPSSLEQIRQPELRRLVELFHRYGKGAEQELLLRESTMVEWRGFPGTP